ncbi:MAG: hypothetical protein ACI910_003262 [Oleispira sp.]|jgi:hypothetical protein
MEDDLPDIDYLLGLLGDLPEGVDLTPVGGGALDLAWLFMSIMASMYWMLMSPMIATMRASLRRDCRF